MPTVTYLKRNPVQTVEQGATSVMLKVVIGASGAVTSYSGFGFGTTASNGVARTGAGLYTIRFDRKYKKLLSYNFSVIQAVGQGLISSIVTDSTASAGTLAIRTAVGATETDPSSGSTLVFHIIVGDTAMRGGTL